MPHNKYARYTVLGGRRTVEVSLIPGRETSRLTGCTARCCPAPLRKLALR